MIYHFDQRSLDCIRSFLWSHGVLMLFRAACFGSTLLPDASGMCHTSLFTGSCHDLIFSGHVMIMLLAVLYGSHFFVLPRALRLLLGADCAATSLLVIITRNHYAVDVLLAIFLTPFVFVAFTRHPALVGLCCLCPDKVLGKSSLLGLSLVRFGGGGSGGGGGGGVAGARAGVAADADADLELGDDGYPLPRPVDVRRVAESAHAVLRLWGLRPRLVIFRNRERRAVYRDEDAGGSNSGDDNNGAIGGGGGGGGSGGGGGDGDEDGDEDGDGSDYDAEFSAVSSDDDGGGLEKGARGGGNAGPLVVAQAQPADGSRGHGR